MTLNLKRRKYDNSQRKPNIFLYRKQNGDVKAQRYSCLSKLDKPTRVGEKLTKKLENPKILKLSLIK